MPPCRDLLLTIARCPIDPPVPEDGGFCRPIITQPEQTPAFQLAEPWSGRLDSAPLLFISSNPSINPDEDAPRHPGDWPDDRIADFFQHRFDSVRRWVDDRRRPRLTTGGYAPRAVPFWGSCVARAAEALDRPGKNIRPGIDFALTEVVHCKSKKEKGVEKALGPCVRRHLEPVLALAVAPVVIVFGKVAGPAIRNALTEVADGPAALCDAVLGGRRRLVAFLPHPNAHGGEKSIEASVGREGLIRIRAALAAPR